MPLKIAAATVIKVNIQRKLYYILFIEIILTKSVAFLFISINFSGNRIIRTFFKHKYLDDIDNEIKHKVLNIKH